MKRFALIAGLASAVTLTLSTFGAQAAPVHAMKAGIHKPSVVEQVHYRRHYVRPFFIMRHHHHHRHWR